MISLRFLCVLWVSAVLSRIDTKHQGTAETGEKQRERREI